MTTESNSNDPQPGKLNKWLAKIHFVLVLAIVGFAFYLYNKSGSDLSLGFALTAASIALTSLGALHLSNAGQKAVIIVSMLVAVGGVWTFTSALKSASESGPTIDKVSFEFSANPYSVEGIGATPCKPKDPANPLHYTCDVKIAPLASTPPAAQEPSSPPAAQ